MPFLLRWVATWCATFAPDPLTAAEAAVLLYAGVPEAEVVDAASRFGGFAQTDEEGRDVLKAAGATDDLIDRLFVSEPTLRRLRRLSESFEPYWRGETLSTLVPRGWRTDELPGARDGVVIRFTPPAAAPSALGPALFVFVQPRSGLAYEAAEAVADALAVRMADRLEAADLRPRATVEGSVRLLGAPADVRVLRGVRGAAAFEIGVAFRLDRDGRAVGVGYLAAPSVRDEVRSLFEDVAAALALRDR
ncbi:MAG TPA: hypothetical protein VEI02_17000 [Planctomycetota bacterium]|nr:hypothetical protein [Planctomycetota bacterium]